MCRCFFPNLDLVCAVVYVLNGVLDRAGARRNEERSALNEVNTLNKVLNGVEDYAPRIRLLEGRNYVINIG